MTFMTNFVVFIFSFVSRPKKLSEFPTILTKDEFKSRAKKLNGFVSTF